MTIQEAVDNLAMMYDKTIDHAFKQKLRRDILIGRAEYIKRHIDRGEPIPSHLIVALRKLELEDADSEELGLEGDYELKRTKYEIPTPIPTNKQANGFTFVGSNDGTVSFKSTKLEYINFMYSRFNDDKTYYDYISRYIYVINSDADSITIEEIPNDDKEIKNLKDIEGNNIPINIVIDEYMFRAITEFVKERNQIIVPRKEADLENENTTKNR